MTKEPAIYGLIAEFEGAESLLDAAGKVRAEGYTIADAFSPFPIHGLSEALGHEKTKVPLTASETGTTATFTLVLTSQPTSDVAAPIVSSDTSEATVSAASLTFTAGNWNTAQTITVTGIDDTIVDGNIVSSITIGTTTSADPGYNGLSGTPVDITTTDNDVAGYTVTGGPLTVSETGTTATFTVVLTGQPATDVVFSVIPSNVAETTVDLGTLTFTTVNWSTPQTITVTGIDDAIVDGSIGSTITVSVIDASSDNFYDALAAQTVNVTTTDDEAGGSVVSSAFEAQTHNFLVRRTDLIASHEPSIQRLQNRENGSFQAGSSGFNVTISNGEMKGDFAVNAKSLATLSATALSGKQVITPTADLPETSSSLNAWMEGQFAVYAADDAGQSQKGDFFIGYAGIDWRLNDRLLLGLMGELDWTEDRQDNSINRVTGTGWMVGPYLSAEPLENIFLDLRAMWGESDNSAIQEVLASEYEGAFDTERWLVNAVLTGKYHAGNLTISPEASVIYMHEGQNDYAVSNGINAVTVDGVNVSLGRLGIGTKISYLSELETVDVEPFIGGRILWDFENPGLMNLDGTIAAREDLRAQFSAGFNLRFEKSLFSLEATYDGLGSEGFEALTGKVMFSHEF